MLESRSAIATALAMGGRDGADGHRRLRLGERLGWHLIQIGHFRGCGPALATAVHGLVGELPTSARGAANRGDVVILRIAPDQYWVLLPDAERAAAFEAAVPADVGTVTTLTGSRTRIIIEGGDARSVLMKLVPIDLHPAVFAVGQYAQTGIHHVGGLLQRVAPDRYEYFALRTYGATMWEAIADAALPFGFDTFTEGGVA